MYRLRQMSCKSTQIRHCNIDREPHSSHDVSVKKVGSRSVIVPWGGKQHLKLAGDYRSCNVNVIAEVLVIEITESRDGFEDRMLEAKARQPQGQGRGILSSSWSQVWGQSSRTPSITEMSLYGILTTVFIHVRFINTHADDSKAFVCICVSVIMIINVKKL